MKKAVLIAALLVLVAVPGFSGTLNVLYYTDYDVGTDVIPGAIALAGATGTNDSGNQAQFNTDLASGSYNVVIFGEQDGTVFPGSSSELAAYLAGGGKIIGATWLSGSGMTSFFGATSTVSSDGSYITTDGNPIFAGLGPTVGLYNPGWGIYDLGNTTGAVCAGALDNGGCGAVIGNGGSTILNAALFDSYASTAQGQQLIANEIGYLASPTPEPSTLLMLGFGLAGIGGTLRKRFSK